MAVKVQESWLRMGSGHGGWTLVAEGSPEEEAWRAAGDRVVDEKGKPLEEPDRAAMLTEIMAFGRARDYGR
jgi:hypothetical protein